MLLWVGRLEREFLPESDMEQDWLLRALRPPLYELHLPSELELLLIAMPGVATPLPTGPPRGSRRLRLAWLSDRMLPPGRGDRYCTEWRFLGTTGLNAVGRISTFSIF